MRDKMTSRTQGKPKGRQKLGRCLVIGHRGAAAYKPENTLLSFRSALEMGADWIETDVRRTSDGSIICVHDPDLQRITGVEGSVESMTYSEISALDTGKGQRVPLVSDVLDFARGKLGVDIELKVKDLEEDIVGMVKQRRMEDDVLVSSFEHETLRVVKSLASDLRTGVLLNTEMDDPVGYTRSLGADSVNPFFMFVDQALVEKAHAAKLMILPWTVDDEDIMTEFVRIGVDGIITNRPDLCAGVVRKATASSAR